MLLFSRTLRSGRERRKWGGKEGEGLRRGDLCQVGRGCRGGQQQVLVIRSAVQLCKQLSQGVRGFQARQGQPAQMRLVTTQLTEKWYFSPNLINLQKLNIMKTQQRLHVTLFSSNEIKFRPALKKHIDLKLASYISYSRHQYDEINVWIEWQ